MIGLIPAGGTAERWGGYIKELLPIDRHTAMIDNCIYTLGRFGCDRFVIVSNPDKIGVIARHINRRFMTPIGYVLGGDTMWGSLLNGIEHCGTEDVIMAMPDTIIKIDDFSIKSKINFGLHVTDDPGRYSVLCADGRFRKDTQLPKQQYAAWGIVGWIGEINRHFLRGDYVDFDTAFNSIPVFDRSYSVIEGYYDMANFAEYARYIRENT